MKKVSDFSISALASLPRPGRGRRVLVTLVSCLVIGLVVVGWRAFGRRDAVRARTVAEAQAQGRAVELQFSPALAAAEVLGALVKQSGGAPPNFQQVGAELMSAHTGLASLELQPGGVVTDIVPRAGHERVIGFNVLKDPANQAGAEAAIRARTLTVAGPVSLYRGEPGLVVRVPVFQRGRDGREVFWGFAAASVRLREVLAQAGVEGLFERGYGYVFYAPQTAEQKAVSIAGRGWSSSRSAVEQPVQAGNLELRLALQPRTGWFSAARIVLESLGAAVLSVLLGLLVSWRERWLDLKATGAEFSTRLAGLTKDRDRTQSELWAAKETAASARSQLLEAEKTARELRERLDGATRALQETAQASAAKLTEADQTIRELEMRLQAAAGAEARVTELTALLEAAQEAAEDQKNMPVPAPIPVSEPAPATPPVVPALTAPEPVPKPTRAKPAKQKPARDQNQLTLFGEKRSAAETEPIAPSPASALVQEQEGESLPITPAEPPPTPTPFVLPEETVPQLAAAAPLEREDIPEPEQPAPIPEAAVDEADRAGLLPPPEPKPPEVEDLKAEPKPKEEKPTRTRVHPPTRPVRLSLLRLAVKQMLPLLIDQDPGAKECLRDHRAVFRPAFAPELFEEFEQCVKKGELSTALDHLRKAVRKHGISV